MRWIGLLLTIGALPACGQSATAEFPVGLEVELDASELALPSELRMNGAMGATVAEVPCGPMGMCPSTAEAPVSCMADMCNPDPQTISVALGDVVDLDELAGDFDAVFRDIDTVEILAVDYRVTENTLTVDIPELEVHWGPPGAVEIDPAMGTRQLGTMPGVVAGASPEGAIALDAGGNAAFSDYFETTSHRFRFFGRTAVDLEPGGAFPEGRVVIQVTMRVRLSGSLL